MPTQYNSIYKYRLLISLALLTIVFTFSYQNFATFAPEVSSQEKMVRGARSTKTHINGIALPPDSKIINESDTSDGKSLSFVSSYSLDYLNNFFQTTLTENGWQSKGNTLKADLSELKFSKNGANITIVSSTEINKTETITAIVYSN